MEVRARGDASVGGKVGGLVSAVGQRLTAWRFACHAHACKEHPCQHSFRMCSKLTDSAF